MSTPDASTGELDADDAVLDTVMKYLQNLPGEWSMGRLIAVYLRDPKQGSTRSPTHRASVQKFLSGADTVHNAYRAVQLMLKHPSSIPDKKHDDYDKDYSLKHDPLRFRHFTPAITSYFAQDVLSVLRGQLYQLFKETSLRARVSQVKRQSDPLPAAGEAGPVYYSDEEEDLQDSEERPVVIRTEPGLEPMSAQKKTRGKSKDKLVDRSTIRDFTMKGLSTTYKRTSPLLWGLLFGVANPTERTDHKHRPPWIVVTSALSQLVFCANAHVNKYQFLMSAYMFGTKAHHSMWRVGSRLGQNLSFTSLRNGLAVISGSNISWIQTTTEDSSFDWAGILDNMQFYAIRRDVRIGVTNAMENGTGAYLLRMVDLEDGALDLLPILANIVQGKRRAATLEALLDDIDWEKADLVVTLHILRILVNRIDCLRKRYLGDVDKLFYEKASMLQINPHRKSEIHPLGSNGANEVTHKGMRAALSDFVFTQMGIKPPAAAVSEPPATASETRSVTPESPKPSSIPSSPTTTAVSVSAGPLLESMEETARVFRRGFPWSGDGKSYDGILRVKRLLHAEKDDSVSNMAFILPELEHWHEEWTYNRSLVHGQWGEGFETEDSSTLGFAANRINSPKPADFSKSVFDTNDRLIRVATEAHVLTMWECVHTSCIMIQ
ncbi:unnamed protein product [Peniophora sp. CBMAI 1063]|nr:unnamed protein product [Peniophora sp. CBMAI 1063]